MKNNSFLILFVFLCIFLIVPMDIYANEINVMDETEENIDEQMLDKLTIEEVNKFWDQIGVDYGEYMPEIRDKNIAELIKENGSLSLKSSVKGIASYLFYELIQNGKLLGTLIILTLFSVVLQSMHAAFEKSAVSKIAYFVVYVVLIY